LLDIVAGFDHQMDQLPALEVAVNGLAFHLLDVVLRVAPEEIVEHQFRLLL
jgi:hypothetical protein